LPVFLKCLCLLNTKDPSPHVPPHLLSKDTLKIGGGLAKVSTHIVNEFMNYVHRMTIFLSLSLKQWQVFWGFSHMLNLFRICFCGLLSFLDSERLFYLSFKSAKI
jgi:hypothetical protein